MSQKTKPSIRKIQLEKSHNMQQWLGVDLGETWTDDLTFGGDLYREVYQELRTLQAHT